MNAPEPSPGAPPPARRPAKKGASLFPKEHGAYAQLALPLLTSLLVGDGSGAALLLAAGIITVFLAHEPILVLLGARGPRTLRELGEKAKRRALVLGLLALSFGGSGLALAPAETYPWIAPVVVLGIPFAYLVYKGREKTIPAELMVGPTLAMASLPVAIAGGASALAAITVAATWSATAMAATLAVREVLWRTKGRRRNERRPPAMPFALVLLAISIGLAARQTIPLLAATAPMPAFAACVAVSMLGVGTSELRTLGWSMIATQSATLILLVASFA